MALGRPVEWVERALDRLQRRDLVYEQSTSTMPGQSEYRFRHILVRDVCYQRLPRAERVLRHQRTADWMAQLTDGRQYDLAEVLANHRWAAHEIARTVGLETAPYAPPARAALHRAARRAYELHALDTAAALVGRALALDVGPDPALELFDAELAFYRDGDAFLVAGGTDTLTRLAERLTASGDRTGAARAWTLLATAAWSRADRSTTLHCLDQAIGIYSDLPDSQEKAGALLELARVHMLNAETEPACTAARAAAALAERLAAARGPGQRADHPGRGALPGRLRLGVPGAGGGDRTLPGGAADQSTPGGAEPGLGVAGGGRPGRLGPVGRRAAHPRPGRRAQPGHQLRRPVGAVVLRG